MSKIVLFNKPYGVLSQFTPEGKWRALDAFIPVKGVLRRGRLDADSEGLLILTDDGKLQARIADPKHKLEKTYWAQVEGLPEEAALDRLRAGIALSDFTAQPAKVRVIDEPAGLWQRDPPIRYRAAIPTAWLEIRIREGKNRQVRRMTAAIGYPTLRLIRAAIGATSLAGLALGQWRQIEGQLPGFARNIQCLSTFTAGCSPAFLLAPPWPRAPCRSSNWRPVFIVSRPKWRRPIKTARSA